MLSRYVLDVWLSTAIHSLSLRIAGEVVWLMNTGAPHERWPLPSNVPLLTATVFGAEVRLKPSPAKNTWPWLSKATDGSPAASYWPPPSRLMPGIRVPRWLGSVLAQ